MKASRLLRALSRWTVAALCAATVVTAFEAMELQERETFGGAYGPVQSESTEMSRDQVYARWIWHDADVHSVFHELSKIAGIDIVVSDRVGGTVTLNVTNKTWKDVFNIVCKLRELVATKEKEYIFVQTYQEMQSKRIEQASGAQQVEQLSPLEREIIRISNVEANEISASIQELLSERGKVSVVEHTNALIVFDTRANIAQVRDMVSKLDVETEQISISAKIIEVSSSSLQNVGVQWGFFGDVGGTPASVEHVPEGAPIVSNPLERLTYGVLQSDRLALTLEYLFQESEGEVVAQPSIMTLDNKEASIFMGSRIPLISKDEAGNNEVVFEEAGTELTVTPHVTDGRRIMLDINAKKESPDATGNIQSQEAQTSVVVSNGETVVIAGLTSNENQTTEDGIPFLKDLPLIGHLFKRSGDRVDKRDLVIFVTPHVIQKQIEKISAETESPAPSMGDSLSFAE